MNTDKIAAQIAAKSAFSSHLNSLRAAAKARGLDLVETHWYLALIPTTPFTFTDRVYFPATWDWSDPALQECARHLGITLDQHDEEQSDCERLLQAEREEQERSYNAVQAELEDQARAERDEQEESEVAYALHLEELFCAYPTETLAGELVKCYTRPKTNNMKMPRAGFDELKWLTELAGEVGLTIDIGDIDIDRNVTTNYTVNNVGFDGPPEFDGTAEETRAWILGYTAARGTI